MNVRQGEQEKSWYRSDRFFRVNGDWYFSTREKVDVGPFDSKERAGKGLSLFIDSMQQTTPAPTVEVAASLALYGTQPWLGKH